MRYASAGAFRTALERRLLTQAEQTDVPLVRLRKLVAFDRLIARLMTVAPDRWILKGAVALHYRVGPQFRSTMDLDLGRHDSEQAATADILLAQSVDLGDYFSFAIQRTRKLDALVEGAAVRYHVTVHVDRRPFEYVTVDVGFGDPPPIEPEVLRGPDLLSFADIPPAEVPTLPIEQHVAEKVHAYTRVYAGGRGSTRVKDLVDLTAIPSLFPFEAGRLRRALQHTFGTAPPLLCHTRCRLRRLSGARPTAGWQPNWAAIRTCPSGTSRRGRSLTRSLAGPSLTTRGGTRPGGRGRRPGCAPHTVPGSSAVR